jgi:hypothetical protein
VGLSSNSLILLKRISKTAIDLVSSLIYFSLKMAGLLLNSELNGLFLGNQSIETLLSSSSTF